jgi:hypothetical protein
MMMLLQTEIDSRRGIEEEWKKIKGRGHNAIQDLQPNNNNQ